MSEQRDFWERTAERFAKDGIRAVCNPTAVGWLNKYGDYLHRICLDPFLESCRGSVVLDVGCGIGRWTSKLLDRGAEVVGVDISRKMLLQAKKKIIQKKRCEFVVSSISNYLSRINVLIFA